VNDGLDADLLRQELDQAALFCERSGHLGATSATAGKACDDGNSPKDLTDRFGGFNLPQALLAGGAMPGGM